MKYLYRVFIIVSVVLLTSALAFGYMIKPSEGANSGSEKSYINSRKNVEETEIKRVNAFKGDDLLRILVVGIDKTATVDLDENSNPTRSDTIMVLTADPTSKKAQLVSIPRDSRVNIKGHGLDKINHSFSFGGYDLLEETVEKFLDIDIDYHVIVDYNAVEKLVDALGGIDMYVPFNYKYEDPTVVPKLDINFKRGQQRLYGKEAVNFLRVRKIYENQDIGRVEAQQGFLLAIFDKMKNPALIFKLPILLDIFEKYVETDLNYGQLADLSYFALSLNRDNIATETIPGEDVLVDGVSYWIVDEEESEKIIKNFPEVVIEDSRDDDEVEDENDSDREGSIAPSTKK